MTDKPSSASTTPSEARASWRLAGFLPYRLSVASNAVSSVIAERYRDRFGLKIPEWRVMAVLGDAAQVSGREDAGDALTQRELTRATLMDKVAVNRACKVLEARGLVARAANEADGRSHLVELTEAGRVMHADIMPLALSTEAELLEGLDAAEQQQFRELLERVHARALALARELP
jgi:DNA-binding MarR family transcriptional regulator